MNTSDSSQLKQLLNPKLIEAELARRARNKISKYYPDTGPLRRELYPKQMQFFRAGAKHTPMPGCCPEDCDGSGHRERGFMAANRCGKSEGAGAYETSIHLTGLYPSWWEGRRFTHPVDAWGCGDTGKTLRDVVQEKLLGKPGAYGTGMIPGDQLIKTTAKSGVPDAVDTIHARHVSGGVSLLGLKSYAEGRESFQGTGKDLIWLDEEPPEDVYIECAVRTMTTQGIILLTFTPLMGLSDVVLSYLPGGRIPS